MDFSESLSLSGAASMFRVSVFVFALLPNLVAAQTVEKGLALCYRIEKGVNALVDYTETLCIPAGGTTKKGYTFILISSKPVFSVEASKKGWVLVAVAITGLALNDNASIRADELWLSDTTQMKNHTAYVISAERVKSLQRRIKADQITLETMYSEISTNLVKKQVPSR